MKSVLFILISLFCITLVWTMEFIENLNNACFGSPNYWCLTSEYRKRCGITEKQCIQLFSLRRKQSEGNYDIKTVIGTNSEQDSANILQSVNAVQKAEIVTTKTSLNINNSYSSVTPAGIQQTSISSIQAATTSHTQEDVTIKNIHTSESSSAQETSTTQEANRNTQQVEQVTIPNVTHDNLTQSVTVSIIQNVTSTTETTEAASSYMDATTKGEEQTKIGDKCALGPSYWCFNEETARKCNKLKWCKQYKWGNRQIPFNNPCTWGATFWCQNTDTAKICEKLQHCIDYVWYKTQSRKEILMCKKYMPEKKTIDDAHPARIVCGLGPDCWCTSFNTAKKCNAINYCLMHNWKEYLPDPERKLDLVHNKISENLKEYQINQNSLIRSPSSLPLLIKQFNKELKMIELQLNLVNKILPKVSIHFAKLGKDLNDVSNGMRSVSGNMRHLISTFAEE